MLLWLVSFTDILVQNSVKGSGKARHGRASTTKANFQVTRENISSPSVAS
jgi:hypothetical protein